MILVTTKFRRGLTVRTPILFNVFFYISGKKNFETCFLKIVKILTILLHIEYLNPMCNIPVTLLKRQSRF